MAQTVPKIEAPVYQPPTAEEIERRRKVAEATKRHRSQLPPLGMDAADLVRELREAHSAGAS